MMPGMNPKQMEKVMKTLEAHGAILEAFEHDPGAISSWFPEGCEIQHPFEGHDATSELLTAGVKLSGQMDECETLDDLREAFDHFAALQSSDVFTGEQWNQAALEVFHELVAWGDAVTAHERN